MKFLKFVVLWVFSTALCGCVSLKTPSNSNQQFKSAPSSVRQQRINKVKRFVASGAFSIQETGKKPVLANYEWKQSTKRFYRIRVFSPLNLFNATILGHLGSVTLWKSQSQQVTAATPEQLLKREMGWSIPIRDLYYWIRGVIAPGQHQVTFDQYGHVQSLQQDGWSIRYTHYSIVDGYDLPQKLIMTRPNIRVTLVVKQWHLKGK